MIKFVENKEESRLRFQIELEFVQSLANPAYIHFLAQQQHFEKKSVINYLKYLLYWKETKYAKYIEYPHCLYFLDLLQTEQFRREIAKPECLTFLHKQQFYHWQLYRNKRLADEFSADEEEPSAFIDQNEIAQDIDDS